MADTLTLQKHLVSYLVSMGSLYSYKCNGNSAFIFSTFAMRHVKVLHSDIKSHLASKYRKNTTLLGRRLLLPLMLKFWLSPYIKNRQMQKKIYPERKTLPLV